MPLTSGIGDHGMKRLLLIPMLLRGGFAFGQATTAADATAGPQQTAGPPMLGIHWARGFEPNARLSHDVNPVAGASRRSPNMTYHGGKIMPTATTKAIFWGTSWGSYSGDKMTGMDLVVPRVQHLQLCKDLGRIHGNEWPGNAQHQSPQTHVDRHLSALREAAAPPPSWLKYAKWLRALIPAATAITLFIPIRRAVVPTIALTTAMEAAGAYRFSSHTSSNSMVTQAATRRTPQDCTRRAWRPSQMSAATNSRRRARIPPAQAPGMTHQVKRTVTNAHGPSAPHSSRSRTVPSGRSRASGPTRPTPPARVTPIALGNRAAYLESSSSTTHHPERPPAPSGGLLFYSMRARHSARQHSTNMTAQKISEHPTLPVRLSL